MSASRARSGSTEASPIQWELTRKELRETLRDQRTILTLLLMPILLYPLLGLAMRYLTLHSLSQQSAEYRLAFATEAEAEWFRGLISQSGRNRNPTSDSRFQYLVPEAKTPLDLTEIVKGGGADAGIQVISNTADTSRLSATEIHLITVANSTRATTIRQTITDVMQLYNITFLQNEFAHAESGVSAQLPFAIFSNEVEPAATVSPILSLLPLVLLLMTVTGGVYPAIDLTAGERERDTLEAIMALPIPSWRILLAKYIAIMSVILLTGFANLLAMAITLISLQLETLLFASGQFEWLLMFKLLLVLMVFGSFSAAVLLVITVSARSFKEAQAWLIPLLLLALLPGVIITLPGWELNAATSAIPLLNVLLLSRELFLGTSIWPWGACTLFTTVVYAAIALRIAANSFGKETFGSQRSSSWRQLLRRPAETGRSSRYRIAWGTLLLLIPLYLLASGSLTGGTDIPLTTRLLVSGMVTGCLFGIVPWVVTRWYRISLTAELRLVQPAWYLWPGLLLTGLCCWPFIFELVILLKSWGLSSFDLAKLEGVQKLLNDWQTVPIPVILISLGILPGICEEFFFRGLLFRGWQTRWGTLKSLLVSSLVFGLFHVIMSGGLAPDRLLPSTLMGFILGIVAWRTGSLFCSMGVHVLHNSALLMLARYQQNATLWLPGLSQNVEHLPTHWLLMAGIGLAAGLLIVGNFSWRSSAAPLATTADP